MSAQSLPKNNGNNGHSAQRRVIVCAGTGCVASGSYKVFQALVEQVRAAGLPVVTEFRPEQETGAVRLNKSGCQGFCQMGPLVTVLPENLLYNKVRLEDVPEIVAETLVGGRVVDRLLYVDSTTKKHCRGVEEIPFYQRQQRFVLRSCGTIDPESIDEYVHQGGYAAAKKAYLQMTPEQICQEISRSGLRGRGGGGFPTGRKWEAARSQPEGKKYVICNADEGDPGAFMNRSVMEGNPHSVLEGLMIAARAIGADETLIYVRTEYPLAVQRMRTAVKDAEAQEATTLAEARSSLVERYFGLRLAREVLSVRRELEAAMVMHADEAHKIEKAGLIAKAERLHAEVALADARMEARSAENDVESAKAGLESLLPQAGDVEPTSTLFMANLTEEREDFKKALLEHQPILKRVDANLQLAHAGVRAQRGRFMPDIYAFGKDELDRDDLTILDPKWAVGVGAKFSIFEGGKRIFDSAAARHQVKSVEAGSFAEDIGLLDGDIIVSRENIPYQFAYTYDILPASSTGIYVANGVLIGSTLK